MSRYNIKYQKELKQNDYKEVSINHYREVFWNVMKDIDIAKDHCGSVVISNLINYWGLDISLEKIYSKVGRGPIFCITRYIKNLVDEFEIRPIYTRSIDKIMENINRNIPVALLLAEGPIDWHWVLAIGYRVYNGRIYIKVLDGWNRFPRYLDLMNGPLLIYGVGYEV